MQGTGRDRPLLHPGGRVPLLARPTVRCPCVFASCGAPARESRRGAGSAPLVRHPRHVHRTLRPHRRAARARRRSPSPSAPGSPTFAPPARSPSPSCATAPASPRRCSSRPRSPTRCGQRFAELTHETSVDVTGEVRAEPRAPGGVEHRRDRPHRSSARARSTIRSSRRSTASTSCSTTATSGCAVAAAARDHARSGTRSSRRSTTSSTSAASCASTRRSSPRPSASARAVRDRVLRGRERVPRADRAALRRGRGRRVREDLHLRPDLPRREVEDAPPPHRVLDDRARGGVERLGRQHAAAGGVRLVPRAARARAPPGGAEGARARHDASSSACRPPFPRARLHRRGHARAEEGERRPSGATTSARRTRRCIVADYDRPVFVLQLSRRKRRPST